MAVSVEAAAVAVAVDLVEEAAAVAARGASPVGNNGQNLRHSPVLWHGRFFVALHSFKRIEQYAGSLCDFAGMHTYIHQP